MSPREEYIARVCSNAVYDKTILRAQQINAECDVATRIFIAMCDRNHDLVFFFNIDADDSSFHNNWITIRYKAVSKLDAEESIASKGQQRLQPAREEGWASSVRAVLARLRPSDEIRWEVVLPLLLLLLIVVHYWQAQATTN